MVADEQETEGQWQHWSSGLCSGKVPEECQLHLMVYLGQASAPVTPADVKQTNETLNEKNNWSYNKKNKWTNVITK